MTQIGQLRQRITLQTIADTPSGGSSGNALTRTFTTVGEIWAKIEAVKGSVYLDSKQLGETITHKITIRKYSTTITSENWILWDSRRFRVRAVQNIDERDRWLVLMCEEEGSS